MLIGQPSAGAPTVLAGATYFDAVPARLAASVNDYAASPDATQIQFNALTALNITGIQGATEGRILCVSCDVGSSTITLVENSGASLAANRLKLGQTAGANLTLLAGQSALLTCLANGDGWRLLATGVPTGGGGGGGGNGFGVGLSTVTSVAAAPSSTLNNYSPAGWNAATVNQFLLTPTGGDVTLNGLDATGAQDNWTCIVANNDAANNLILANEAAGSTAGNRFTGWGGADIVVVPGQVVLLCRIGSRWRIR